MCRAQSSMERIPSSLVVPVQLFPDRLNGDGSASVSLLQVQAGKENSPLVNCSC
jgi:hypothetical protein